MALAEKRAEIQALLVLNDKIKAKIASENDEMAVSAMKNDVKKLKEQIGKKILALPADYPLFDAISPSFDGSLSSILTGDQNDNTIPGIPKVEPGTIAPSHKILASKFENFMKEKSKAKLRPTDIMKN